MDQNADDLLADPPDQVRAFISAGRITAIPAKRTRRRLLLNEVAQAFEPGRRYPEAAVDEILKQVSDDHCALRRYLAGTPRRAADVPPGSPARHRAPNRRPPAAPLSQTPRSESPRSESPRSKIPRS